MNTISQRVSYIAEASRRVTADPKVVLSRRVTCLNFHVLPSDEEPCVFTPPGSEHIGGGGFAFLSDFLFFFFKDSFFLFCIGFI